MNEGVDLAVVAIRFIVFGLAMLAFGRAAFDLYAPASRSSRRWRVATGALLALAAIAYTVLLAREAVGAPGWPGAQAIATIWWATGFGRALAVTAIGAAALALIGLSGRTLNWPTAVVAAVALAALAFVGHGADDTGARGAVRLALLTTHLLAVAAWLGALPALWQGLARNGGSVRLLHRFGLVGGVSVALIMVSGGATLVFVALGARDGLGAGYVRTLAVKLAFVLGLIILAAVNRLRLTPMMAREPERARRWLQRTIIGEQALGLGALASVALLGQLDPGM